MTAQIDLRAALKTTPSYVNRLNDAGILTVKDFLCYFPRAYEDRSQIIPVHLVQFDDTTQSIKATITSSTITKTRTGKKIAIFNAEDEHGGKMIAQFIVRGSPAYLFGQLQEGQPYIFTGKPKRQ